MASVGMKLISATHNGAALSDAQGALDLFLAQGARCGRIWVDLSGGIGSQCDRHTVGVTLADVYAEIEVSFKTPEEALAFVSSADFAPQCDDVKGSDFYSRFIATNQNPGEWPPRPWHCAHQNVCMENRKCMFRPCVHVPIPA